MGGPCDFSVSPSPFGPDFGTSDSGLTIILVNYSVVSGGAALIGGSLIAATSIFTPAAGALVLGNN